jgi:hypothetical protein
VVPFPSRGDLQRSVAFGTGKHKRTQGLFAI